MSHLGACQRAWDQLSVDPYFVDGHRWIQLRGKTGAGIRQHEVGGGARIWFRIDQERHAVYVEPFPGHPKATEKRRR